MGRDGMRLDGERNSSNGSTDPLRPVAVFLPDWSARRIADNARAGRIPGAVKVGGMWMLRGSDFARWFDARQRTALDERGPAS